MLLPIPFYFSSIFPLCEIRFLRGLIDVAKVLTTPYSPTHLGRMAPPLGEILGFRHVRKKLSHAIEFFFAFYEVSFTWYASRQSRVFLLIQFAVEFLWKKHITLPRLFLYFSLLCPVIQPVCFQNVDMEVRPRSWGRDL